MKSKFLIILVVIQCLCGFSVMAGMHTIQAKNYYHEDGSYVSSSVTTTGRDDNAQRGPAAFYFAFFDAEGNRLPGGGVNDFNYIAYNKAGEVTSGHNYYSPRITYVVDDDDRIVGLKSSWTGPMVETFRYTDSGKMLAYNMQGQLMGAYDDLLDYHFSRHGGHDGYFADSTGLGSYVSVSLNLIGTDGRFYDYDQQGNVLAVYESDGSMSKYDKGGNLLRKTDHNGNIIWARRIYTVDEAEAASKSNHNSFRIRYK